MNEQLLGEDMTDEEKKAINVQRLTESQSNTLWWVKVAFGIVTLLSAIAAFVLVLLTDTKPHFELILTATDDYRRGDTVQADGYPDFIMGAVGSIRIGLAAAFASLLASFGYLFVFAFHSAEISQMNQGSNPYVWIFFLIWHIPYFLVIAFVSGVHNVFVLTLLSLGVWAWLFLFWADDLLHSNAYMLTKLRARARGASSYAWVPFIQILILALTILVVVYIYLGFTFSAEAAPNSILLAIPITLGVLYLLHPLIYGLYIGGVGVNSIYTRELGFYVSNGILALVATWLTLGIFTGDDIEPVHPSDEESAAAMLSPLAALAGSVVASLALRA